MRTLLTNAKMHPALAARVEASVSGRLASPGDSASAARVRAVLRVLVVVSIVTIVVVLVLGRRQEKQELDRDRAALQETLRSERASMSDAEQQAVPRDESWLLRESGPYEGDVFDASLAAPGAFDALLAEPIVYVHGDLDGFQRTARIPAAASSSVKDAFTLCLIEPPSRRTESAVLPKVYVAYAGGSALDERTPALHRLHDAEAGAQLLSAAFEERVEQAHDARTLKVLKAELDPAVVARAKAAMQAKILLAVMDEPAVSGATAELDGERPHAVRVTLVDLAANRVLLRAREHVDPAAWSAKARSEYATGLDGCALAFDVRQRLPH